MFSNSLSFFFSIGSIGLGLFGLLVWSIRLMVSQAYWATGLFGVLVYSSIGTLVLLRFYLVCWVIRLPVYWVYWDIGRVALLAYSSIALWSISRSIGYLSIGYWCVWFVGQLVNELIELLNCSSMGGAGRWARLYLSLHQPIANYPNEKSNQKISEEPMRKTYSAQCGDIISNNINNQQK